MDVIVNDKTKKKKKKISKKIRSKKYRVKSKDLINLKLYLSKNKEIK